MQRLGQFGFLLAAILAASACVSHADQRCVSDDECRGDRACGESGWCVDPTAAAQPDAGDADAGSDADSGADADVRPPAPDLVVEPTRLAFPLPDPTARQRIEWKLLYMRNRGDLPLTIDSVRVPDSDSFALRFPRGGIVDEPGEPDAEPTEPPAEIAPGESAPIRVWYSTDDARSESAVLEILSNDPDSPALAVPLTANADPPCIEYPDGNRIVFETRSPRRQRSFSIRNCSGTHDLIIDDFRLEQDGGGALKLDETELPAFPTRLGPGSTLDTEVELTSTRDDWNRGVIVVETNDPYRPRTTVDILRDSAGNDCPVASVVALEQGSDRPIQDTRQIEPGTVVELDGSGSADPDGQVVRYAWRPLEAPAPVSLQTSDGGARATLNLDQPGTYLIELVVFDDDGAISCAAPAQARLVATRNDIRVEVDWRTPGDPNPNDGVGANVDLHYLHPNGRWNERPWDIWEDHPTADWSRIQRPDTPPEMLEVTENGPGSEALYHATPEWDREFAVGLHYADDRGLGPSFATLRLLSDDQVVWESREVRLDDTGDFYEAAHFAMPGPTIIEIDEKSEDFPLR